MHIFGRRLQVFPLAFLLAAPTLAVAQETHTVMVMDNDFSPPFLQIETGDTVHFLNRADNGNFHDVVSEDGLWTPPELAESFSFEYTFTQEGNFGYFCTPHQLFGMTGIVQVVAPSGPAPVPFNAGHNGNWWNGPPRSGEGAQVEVADAGGGQLVVVITVYSYGPLGGQIFLIAVGTPVGDTVEVEVFITDGTVWGSGFDPNDVNETPWGTGVFTTNGCDEISMTLTPNATYQSLGYEALSYLLVRLTTPLIPCPYVAPN